MHRRTALRELHDGMQEWKGMAADGVGAAASALQNYQLLPRQQRLWGVDLVGVRGGACAGFGQCGASSAMP